MAKLPGSFNTKAVTGEMGKFETIPNGDYTGKMKKNERVPTKENLAKNGNNKQLIAADVHRYSITWEITQGPHKGRVIFTNLNLEHEKESAREMAEIELKAICEAHGKITIDDLDELQKLNREITLTVGLGKASAQYPANNVIKGYAPLKGAKKPAFGSAAKADEVPETEEPAPEVKKSAPKVSFGKK